MRLDLLLARLHPETSRTRLKHLILDGNVAVDGAVILKPAADVSPEAVISVTFPPPAPLPGLVPLDLPLDILFEDSALIGINKPPGLPVHPSPGHDQDTLVNALLSHCPDLPGIGPYLRPGIVHRLDLDTSGVLVVAKTEDALHALSAQFSAHTTKKEYLALVWGIPFPPTGLVDAAMGRSPRNRQKQALLPLENGGREARTHYKVVASAADGTASLMALRIETGRTHQIRVHMSAVLHHPVCGDHLYGGRRNVPEHPCVPPRQMLHAYRLTLLHPTTGVPMTFTAPLPADFLEALAQLLPGYPATPLPDLPPFPDAAPAAGTALSPLSSLPPHPPRCTIPPV